MDRREVLQRLMGTLGAGLAIPALGASHPMRRHLADHAGVAAADAKASVGAKPEFLSAGQLETLGSAAERILPGSTRARVAPFIDQLLAVDTPENQRRFLSALETLDTGSTTRYHRSWQALDEAQQVELLTTLSTADPAAPEKPPTPRDDFEHLKGWIVGAYYSSETGMRELGWTGNVFYASFPGCPHPEGHG
jgi:Gluconate 2-dehydrogenase subunit 3